jgi:hypothetical protein
VFGIDRTPSSPAQQAGVKTDAHPVS